MRCENPSDDILINSYPERQGDLFCNARTSPARLRCFISITARIKSAFGPFGPGFLRRLGENSRRYFRCTRCRLPCGVQSSSSAKPTIWRRSQSSRAAARPPLLEPLVFPLVLFLVCFAYFITLPATRSTILPLVARCLVDWQGAPNTASAVGHFAPRCPLPSSVQSAQPASSPA